MMTSKFAWTLASAITRAPEGDAGAGAAAASPAAGGGAGAGGEGGKADGASGATPGQDQPSAATGEKAPVDGATKQAVIDPAAKAANDALAKAGDNVKPPVADMKKELATKLEGGEKALEGKTDAEIEKLFDDQKAKEAAAAADEQKKKDDAAKIDFEKGDAAEIYKDIKFPEGFQVEAPLLDDNLAFFKAEKIDPALGQKIVNQYLKTNAAMEAGWTKDINDQFGEFTKDSEFWKDGKLTPVAEKAYGDVKTSSPEITSFFSFLNKNGGLFHPGLKLMIKNYSQALSEGKIIRGDAPAEGDKGGPKAFYSKSNHKK